VGALFSFEFYFLPFQKDSVQIREMCRPIGRKELHSPFWKALGEFKSFDSDPTFHFETLRSRILMYEIQKLNSVTSLGAGVVFSYRLRSSLWGVPRSWFSNLFVFTGTGRIQIIIHDISYEAGKILRIYPDPKIRIFILLYCTIFSEDGAVYYPRYLFSAIFPRTETRKEIHLFCSANFASIHKKAE
jgi:hypothetical protein